MFFHDFIEPLGSVELKHIQAVEQFAASQGFFSEARYDRFEPTLTSGRLLCVMHRSKVQDLASFRVVNPILEAISSVVPERSPYRVEIATVHPGSSLRWHIDLQKFHQLSMRIHVPITISPTGRYYFRWPCSEQIYKLTSPLEIGTIYNYNNRIPHTACNLMGPTALPRVTIIADYIKNEMLPLLESDVNSRRGDKLSSFERKFFMQSRFATVVNGAELDFAKSLLL